MMIPLFHIKNVKAKITYRQAFLAIYILCISDDKLAAIYLYVLEHINDFQTIGYGSYFVF